jgi:hypothetical protein
MAEGLMFDIDEGLIRMSSFQCFLMNEKAKIEL